MDSPLISVIIPTYNRAALLCEAIDTVLSQTYTNTEIIVIDDGSTDETTAAVQKYGDRVRYTRRPNAGVNAARNLGLKQARGEFVALLDSDDLWAPSRSSCKSVAAHVHRRGLHVLELSNLPRSTPKPDCI